MLAVAFALTLVAGPDTGKAAPKLDSLPLKTTRTIDYETSEGTWMSLDVSADGRTIVFELMGDLYTLPIGGGAATRITSGPAFDSQPRYSPDGKRIVFLSDRDGAENVWVMDADGSHTKQITKGGTSLYASPEWTPDGKYVVASKTESPLGSAYTMWIYHVDGGSGSKLVTDKGDGAPGGGRGTVISALGAAFGSDPRYVWFARHRGGFGYDLQLPQWELAIYDRVAGKVFQQTDALGSAMRPVLSPDGKWLVYATRHDAETGLRLRDLKSGDEKWLAWPVTRDDQESRYTRDLMPGSSFTPDSKYFVTSYGGKFWKIDIGTAKAEAIPFSAKVDLDLGPLVHFDKMVDTGLIQVTQIRNPSLSPDGKRIVYSAMDRIYVQDWPGGTPKRLTTDSVHEQSPIWSPDGKFVAYITWSDEGGYVNKVSSDGKGKPQHLTGDEAFYDTPAWSPDGQKIVFLRGPRLARVTEHYAPGYELDWVPANGGPATKITPVTGGGRPHFSRNSERIYQYDGDELVSFRFDGTDRRSHIKVTGYTPNGPGAEPNTADEIIISPDSDQVLAQVNNNVYLVALPVIGATTPSISVSDPSSASFPVKRLTKIGGDFIAWAPDGKSVSWSIGRAFFRYDPATADSLAKLKATKDSIRADSLKADTAKGKPDSAAKARVDSLTKLPAYEAARTDVDIKVARDVPHGTVVLKGARIITMKGTEIIDNGDVIVHDNRIVYVGPSGGGNPPKDAKVIDASGKTIIPGFVDLHAHPWPVWGVHQNEVWKYLANLAWGVTTTRDPQTATTDVLTYADQVESGDLMGPRIYHTGPGVFWDENFQSLDEARNTLKRYSEFYRVWTIKQYMTGNRKQRQWVIMAAKELGLMPTSEGGLDFKMDLTEAMDGYPGREHSYPIMPLYEDAVKLIAGSGTIYTPTLLVSYGGPFGEDYFYEHNDIHEMAKVRRFIPHEEVDNRALRRPGWFRDDQYVFPRIAEGAKKIVEAGGKVGLGGHGQLDGLGDHWELWALASGGMKPFDVLRVATIFGAQGIGIDHDLGSIEPGKLADLLVLDKNPLDDIHNTNTIHYVMKNGRLYEGETLDEVWPRQRKLPAPWWWNRDPAGEK
ncbi:MAG TPA: amidohydrolase family protein [Gemmatimonadales bacterium]|nr:amidohydrolase family protein [Gemmatimonadales bacterium]